MVSASCACWPPDAGLPFLSAVPGSKVAANRGKRSLGPVSSAPPGWPGGADDEGGERG